MATFRTDDINFLFKLRKYLEDQSINKAEKALGIWKTESITKLKVLIGQSLDRGLSPVENGGRSTMASGRRYKKYSDSYKKRIKAGKVPGKTSVSPVNLKATGQMRRSLKGRPTIKGIALYYSSPISKYHNDEGAGLSKIIRQILPDDNQNFTRSIDRELTDLYTRIFERLK